MHFNKYSSIPVFINCLTLMLGYTHELPAENFHRPDGLYDAQPSTLLK